MMMNHQKINTAIVDYLAAYEPLRIGVFGSYARQEETEDSDIDILVRFKKTLTLFDLARIHRELSELLGRKVDIVTEASLKNKRLRRYIYNDLKVIY